MSFSLLQEHAGRPPGVISEQRADYSGRMRERQVRENERDHGDYQDDRSSSFRLRKQLRTSIGNSVGLAKGMWVYQANTITIHNLG
jgi:hypothetical protein